MQTAVWILRLVIVLVLVWFADKNSDPVKLRGFLDQSWQAPLAFVLLIVFVCGMVIGLLAWVPTVVRQRREIGRLKRTQAAIAATPAPPPSGPTDGV
jgi:lipopolysaccharide assembly protein A